MEHLMKKLPPLLLLLISTGYSQQFNGTIIDLDTGRLQTINGSLNERRNDDDTLARLRKMNAELETSLDAMRQEEELRRQTRELREQTELLRRIANQ